MLDFSGERVVPGLVDDNLFNEHLSRYRFAARFVTGAARILDAGCGSGYGSAQFPPQATVIGIDVAHDAVIHARENFGRPGVAFLQASCETIPFADASFDIVAAFEVIEHLERWQDLLRETRRVLKPTGVLLVSTPNKSYYAETRTEAGPNPFHVHEFEYDEFARALNEVFPHAHLWSQNHAEAIAFTSTEEHGCEVDAPPDKDPATAHFYFAACSASPILNTEAFVWLPGAGNVLREREHHIALLEKEVRQKTAWLETQTHEHTQLKDAHDATIAELEQRNQWATQLNDELSKARQMITDLQKETLARLDWVRDLEGQIARGSVEMETLRRELTKARHDFGESLKWGEEKAEEARIGAATANHAIEQAKAAAEEAARLQGKLDALNALPYVRFGRKLGAVPDISNQEQP